MYVLRDNGAKHVSCDISDGNEVSNTSTQSLSMEDPTGNWQHDVLKTFCTVVGEQMGVRHVVTVQLTLR